MENREKAVLALIGKRHPVKMLPLYGNDGTALTFRNLLVLGAETKTIDDYGRLAVTLTGKGEGHLIRDGQCVPITWSREKEDMPFTYTLADGSPATLAAGKTYVAVVPPESALDLE